MTVLFSVDAQRLDKTKQLKPCAGKENLRFDHVAFYFPHVGKLQEETIIRLKRQSKY